MSEQKRKRAIRAYQSYLNAIRLSHEQSFLQVDIEEVSSAIDRQISINSEIEIVEDIIQVLESSHRIKNG
jgi:hypothetical protein